MVRTVPASSALMLENHGASFGNEWNARVFAECREHAAAYLREVAEWFPASRALSARLADAYGEVARNLTAIADPSLTLGEKKRILARTRALEVTAVDDLERLLGRLPGNANAERVDSSPAPRFPAGHDERGTERPALLAEVKD